MRHSLHILMLFLALCLTACNSNNNVNPDTRASQAPLIPATIIPTPLIPATIIAQPLTPSQPNVTDLIMLGGEQAIAPNTTIQLFSAAKINHGIKKDVTSSVTWVSSDPSVAKISSTGLLTGLKQGKTTISALYSGVSSNKQDLVISPIQSINIVNDDHGTPPKEKDFVMHKNSKKQIRIMATLVNKATTELTDQVTWETKNENIATVDKTGLITAVFPGTTSIIANIKTASGSYIHAQMEIDVQASGSGKIAIYGDGSISASIKTPKQLICLLTMDDNQVVDVTKYAQWSSSNTDIAGIDKNGLVTGKKAGSTVIKCNINGVFSTHNMKFQSSKLVSIELHKGNQLIKNMPAGAILNNTTQIIYPVKSINYPSDINGRGISSNGFYPTAWAVFDDGTKENITKYTSWSSSDEQDVYLNYLKGPYLFARKLAQNVLITASFAGHSSSFKVDVEDAPPQKLSSVQIFWPDGTQIKKGIIVNHLTSVRLHAIGYYPNGGQKNITPYIRYSIKDPSAAILLNDLNPNVLSLSKANRSTTVTATWQGVKKTFTVTSK